MQWTLIITSVLLLGHGLVHILGFMENLGIHDFQDFTNRTTVKLNVMVRRIFGLIWLLTAITLAGAGVLLINHQDSWRLFAFIGIVVSQLLLTIWWSDGWRGTFANLLILIAIVWASSLSLTF